MNLLKRLKCFFGTHYYPGSPVKINDDEYIIRCVKCNKILRGQYLKINLRDIR